MYFWELKIWLDTSYILIPYGSKLSQKKRWDLEHVNEQWKKGPWLFKVYIGDYTTPLYSDYEKPLQGSLINNQYFMESKAGYFSWLKWF